MKSQVFQITGMHCQSCNVVIKHEFEKEKNVVGVNPDYKTGRVEVKYQKDFDVNKLNERIKKYGYEINLKSKISSFDKLRMTLSEVDVSSLKTNSEYLNSLIVVGVGLVFVLILVLLSKNLNFSSLAFLSSNRISFLTAFLIGVLASFSTCMATTGAFFLSISEELKKEGEFNNVFSFTTLFSAGRVLSYLFFGGLIGLIGKSFILNPLIGGIFTIIVSVLMLLVALSLLNIKIFYIDYSFQKLVDVLIDFAKQNKVFAPLILGGATFFMPCGFTQSLQLYALQSGGFINGALILGIFAIGSLPSILGIGFVSSLVKNSLAKNFSYLAAILIIVSSFYNISNSVILMGIVPFSNKLVKKEIGVKLTGEKQIVEMVVNSRGYTPDVFTIKRGVPVVWKINGVDVRGCQRFIIVPKLNIQKNLDPGENIVEFTPQESGSITFSCGMGMFRGKFEVI